MEDSKTHLTHTVVMEGHNDANQGQVLFHARFMDKLPSYWMARLCFVFAITVYGIALLPFCCFFWGAYKNYFNTLECILTTRSLIVRSGGNCGSCCCFKRIEKTILLDRIQDVNVSQGCIERCWDIETLTIETAGQSGPNAGPEASLNGIINPREFRDAVLSARHRAVGAGGDGLGAGPPPSYGSTNQASILGDSREYQVLLEIRDSLRRIEANNPKALTLTMDE